MIDDLELLQHRYYSDWKRDDGCRNGSYCKFCMSHNPHPTKEYHSPECDRLGYLAHYYGVTPRKSPKPYRNVIVDGTEFTRSDVYGWWTNQEEFTPLIKEAFRKERAQ